ncbi:MAG: DUF4430 domain-containing protein [Clostridiales Family XIII bacterium]|nr:DUF4430 domain-containing protein [Clostridiales Family XIII bacterium]
MKLHKFKSIIAAILIAAMSFGLSPAIGSAFAAESAEAVSSADLRTITINYSLRSIAAVPAQGISAVTAITGDQLEVYRTEDFSADSKVDIGNATIDTANRSHVTFQCEPGYYYWRTFAGGGDSRKQTADGVFLVDVDGTAVQVFYLLPVKFAVAEYGCVYIDETEEVYDVKITMFDMLQNEVKPIHDPVTVGDASDTIGLMTVVEYLICTQLNKYVDFRVDPSNPDYAINDYSLQVKNQITDLMLFTPGSNHFPNQRGAALTEIEVKVTHGAPIMFFNKVGAHFTPFRILNTVTLESENVDGYDIYKARLPYYCTVLAGGGSSPFVKTAVELQNIGRAQNTEKEIKSVNLNLQTIGEVTRTRQGHRSNDLYLNINDAQHLVMPENSTFELVPLRVWQGLALDDTMANFFVNPDYRVEVLNLSGQVSAASKNNPGRDSFIISSGNAGLSVVKVTYDPLQWYKTYTEGKASVDESGCFTPTQTDVFYPETDPVHEGIFIVNTVSNPAAANPTNLQTNIKAQETNTYYFDRDVSDYAEYTFTPAVDNGYISVRVHDPLHNGGLADEWNKADKWTTYRPNADGSYTINLKEGRNIVEVAASSQDFKQYHVIKAKGVTVNITNLSNPDWKKGDNAALGDTVQIFFDGVESAPIKLAGIYNSGSMHAVYETSWGATMRGVSDVGYDFANKNLLNLTFIEPGAATLSKGVATSSGWGSASGAHHSIGENGVKANLNADAVSGDFSILPDISFYVEDDVFAREKEKNEYALPSGISYYTTSVEAETRLPDIGRFRNFDVPLARAENGNIYVSTALHFYAVNGKGYYRNWVSTHPDSIAARWFYSDRAVMDSISVSDWGSTNQGFLEAIITPDDLNAGNPVAYTFRRILEEDRGRYPYIQDVQLNLDNKADADYYSGRLFAADADGSPAAVDTSAELSGDGDKPVLSLGYGFLATRSSYIAEVPYNVNNVRVNVRPFTEPNGKVTSVTVNGMPVSDGESSPIALTGDETIITVVGIAADNDTDTGTKNTVTYTIKVKRGAAPPAFTIAVDEGATLTIRKPDGARVTQDEDGAWPLPVADGYRYYVEKSGYVTKTGAFDVKKDTESVFIPAFTDADKLNQASGAAKLKIISQNTVLYDGVIEYDAGKTPADLARQGYVEYNPGGYTVLHALIDALSGRQPQIDFTAYQGKLTPNVTINGEPLAGAAWVLEANGLVTADYWKTLVKPNDEIVLYYNENNSGQQRAWFTNEEISVAKGGSIAFTLRGKPVGTDGTVGAAIENAQIYIDGNPAQSVMTGASDLVTDENGNVTIHTGDLALGAHIISAKLGSPNKLTYARAVLTVTPSDELKNVVTFRLVGAAKHADKPGYGAQTEYQNWINPVEYSMAGKTSATVFDVFDWALGNAGLSYTEGQQNYISAIAIPAKYGGGMLTQADNGSNSGWMYTVNGVHTSQGLRAQQVKAGDEIIWHYVDDFYLETDMDGGTPQYPNGWLIPPDTPDIPYETALASALTYLRTSVPTPVFGTGGGEWTILALARSGYTEAAYYDGYYSRVFAEINGKAKIDENRSTENSRAILGLTAIGLNAANVEGNNLVAPLADMTWVNRQGINGAIYALLAIDSGGYELTGAREALVNAILEAEISGGGWSLGGANPDPDITAMCLQALAPYRTQAEVEEAISRAITWLSNAQQDDGTFIAWGDKSSENISQLIVALSALGIDADTDTNFIKNGKSPIDFLLSFADANGGFKHTWDGAVDGMATDQAAYALVAYERFVKKLPALYDMSDAKLLITDTTPAVDKTLLSALIAKAEAAVQSPASYTASSLNNLKNVLAAAKTIEAKPSATQEEVDAAKTALSEAIAKLETTGGSTGDSGISVSFRLIGATRASKDVNLSAGVNDSEYVTWIPTSSYTLNRGATMYDLFMLAIQGAGLSQTGAESNYVKTITAPTVLGAYRLSEFTNGSYSGWMYTVNGSHPGYGIKEQTLHDGDKVVWHYVNDYRHEVGDWFSDLQYPTLGDGSQYNKWLNAPDRLPTSADAKTPGGTSGTASTSEIKAEESLGGGTAKVVVKSEDVKAAVDKAKKDKSTAVSITVKGNESTKIADVTLPKSSAKEIADNGFELVVKSPVGDMSFSKEALTAIAAKTGDTLEVIIADQGKTETLKTSNKAFSLTVKVGGAEISELGGSVAVSLPYTKNTDDDAELLTVYKLGANGDYTEIKDAKYDAATGKMVFTTSETGEYFVSEWISPFEDIKRGDWYYKAIRYVYAKGLMNGTGDSAYAPQTALTRAMLITILAREAGIDTNGGETWYSKAVEWGITNRITDGTNPNGEITREQFAAMLYRYSGSPKTEGGTSDYTDAEKISSWAEEAMTWAVNGGLLTGRTKTTLAPEGTATRAEAATLLQRYLERAE